MLSCVELFILISWREGHLVIGEVTHFPPQSSRCGRTEFLRRLGHDKSRVRILYPKPDGILYYYFVPTSDVACVETGINTIRNRTQMCTHPTGGSQQYVPKPRLRYGMVRPHRLLLRIAFISRSTIVLKECRFRPSLLSCISRSESWIGEDWRSAW